MSELLDSRAKEFLSGLDIPRDISNVMSAKQRGTMVVVMIKADRYRKLHPSRYREAEFWVGNIVTHMRNMGYQCYVEVENDL